MSDFPSPLEGDRPALEVVGICHKCKHRTDTFTCTAFPNGIPKEILVGDFTHTRPYNKGGRSDHGIMFERADGVV